MLQREKMLGVFGIWYNQITNEKAINPCPNRLPELRSPENEERATAENDQKQVYHAGIEKKKTCDKRQLLKPKRRKRVAFVFVIFFRFLLCLFFFETILNYQRKNGQSAVQIRKRKQKLAKLAESGEDWPHQAGMRRKERGGEIGAKFETDNESKINNSEYAIIPNYNALFGYSITEWEVFAGKAYSPISDFHCLRHSFWHDFWHDFWVCWIGCLSAILSL